MTRGKNQKDYDAVVVGLGIMGSAIAAELAARGLRVLGLEQFEPGHDRGSSHGETRVIRQAYFESPAYVPLTLRAYELWRAIEAETGQDLFTMTGGLMIGPPQSQVFRGSLESAQTYNLAHEVWDAREIRRRFPVFEPEPHFTALYEKKLGILKVEACVAALQNLAVDRGADCRYGGRVVSWENTGNAVRVTTESGANRARHLILAAGPWASRVLASAGFPLTVERLAMFWFQPRTGVSCLAADPFPVHLWEVDDGTCFYGIPSPDRANETKLCFHNVRSACDPDTVDRRVSTPEIQQIQRYLTRYVPKLSHRFIRAKICLYTTTPDSHFILGEVPGQERVWAACGFSGHGFKFAPVVGEIVADLLAAGATRHPIADFDPRRFSSSG